VSADTEQIIDVLQNLVDNAADALDEGRGRIDVSTGIVECKRDELSRMHADPDVLPGRFVFLEVRDSGEGMDEATLSKIFEPFFSTRFTGRGLGLSAVLGIVRGHGGAIDVETRPDDGTRVRVLLPVDGSASRTP